MNKMVIDWPSRGHGYLESEIASLSDFLKNDKTSLTQNSNVVEFENVFSSQFTGRKAIALMSAAHALDLIALRLSTLTNKKTIICPAHTYTASALSFLRAGFKVHLVDIDAHDWTISDDFSRGIDKSEVAGVVVVHLYGKASKNSGKVREFCNENNAFMIEDCAQALGAKYDGVNVGQLGDFSCFSFHSQKNITTLGEGGMLVTHDNYANEFKELRINGHRPYDRKPSEPYWLPAMVDTVETIEGILPMKSTMSESQALMGRLVFSRYSDLHAHRHQLIKTFHAALKCNDKVALQEGILDNEHARHLLPLRIIHFDRNELISQLFEDYSIKAIVQYYPLNRYDLFKKNPNVTKGDLVHTDEFFDNMISLPFSATLSSKEMLYMANALNEILC